MKLASFKDGSRDGQLLVVSRDLTTAHFATGVATRLQQVLDDWNFLSPQLEDLYTTLNQGKARHAFAFDPRLCMAPLPRAFEWVHCAPWHNTAESLHGAALAVTPPPTPEAPLMHPSGSDDFLGARDEAVFGRAPGPAHALTPTHGAIDFGAGFAVITGDVALGSAPAVALDSVRLLLLVNDWRRHAFDGPTAGAASLGDHGEPGASGAAAAGVDQAAPSWRPRGVQKQLATTFGPVAVTPDELGDAWRGGRVHLNVEAQLNAKRMGLCPGAEGMPFHFGELLAHRAQTRRLRAGAMVGSGTLRSVDTTRGFACLADKRAFEMREQGAPKTGYLQAGDRVRIDVKGRDGHSVFGGIDQTVRWDGEDDHTRAAADDTTDKPA